jgi:hypothetical protein
MQHNSNNGGSEVYDISNNQITGAAFIGTVDLNCQFSGVGNFSGVAGETDLLLRNVPTSTSSEVSSSSDIPSNAFALLEVQFARHKRRNDLQINLGAPQRTSRLQTKRPADLWKT